MMNFLSNEMLRLLLPRLLDCMRLPEIPEDEEALELLQHARLFAAEVSHHIRKIPSVDERFDRRTYLYCTYFYRKYCRIFECRNLFRFVTQRQGQTVETALVPWAALLTNADTWIAQLWNPLQEVESTLSTMGDNEEGFMAESWFAAKFTAFESCLASHHIYKAFFFQSVSSTVFCQNSHNFLSFEYEYMNDIYFFA